MTDDEVRVHWRPEGVRYVSGLTIYDEGLIDGRWLGRTWAASGYVKPEKDITAELRRRVRILPGAFVIEVDGQNLGSHWRWKASSDTTTDTGLEAIVELENELRPITIRICTRLDGTPVIERWLEITNTGSEPAALGATKPFATLVWAVGAGLERPEAVARRESPFSRGYLAGANWGQEGDFRWEPVPAGRTTTVGRRGRSGFGRPSTFLRNEMSGESVMLDLAWSGNWTCQLDRIEEQNMDLPIAELLLLASIGPDAESPQRMIEPGETVRTPSVHVGYLHGDLDATVQALHTHVRRSVMPAQPPGRGQRVQANHWGYVADRVATDYLRRDIDVAAAVGCELYIVDAGWFGSEPGAWWVTVGDWEPGDWLEGGVHATRAYAREKGLLFGLWMEPETVGGRSRLFQEHPEWVLRRDGQPVGRVPGTRDRFSLDFANPAAAAWLDAEMDRLVSTYDLDLLRIDYNVDMWAGGETFRDGYAENSLWRHYEALYASLDRLRAKYPNLLIETCSSGGGRTDLGILGRTHTTWLSDWAQVPRGLQIFNGETLFLPPEVCNRMVGLISPDEHTYGDLDFQMRVAFLGQPVFVGIAPSLEELIPAHRARLEHTIRLYKEVIRPLLPTSRVFHHTPVIPFDRPDGACILEYASPSGDVGVCAVFRLLGETDEFVVRPRGLGRGRTYRVSFDSAGDSVVLSGAALARDGLLVRLATPLTSELIVYGAES